MAKRLSDEEIGRLAEIADDLERVGLRVAAAVVRRLIAEISGLKAELAALTPGWDG